MKKHVYGANYIVLPSKKSFIHLLRQWTWCKFYRNNLGTAMLTPLETDIPTYEGKYFLCFIITKIKYI